jgi:hypothetical protein
MARQKAKPMNTIDELVDRDPKDLTPADYVEIIAMHRQARADLEAGIKVKKDKGPAVEAPKLVDIGLIKAKPVLEFKRRL